MNDQKVKGRLQEASERVKNFQEVEFGYNDEEALQEASRCLQCKNPRCITQTEHYVKPTFILTDKSKGVYRCEYCDTLYLAGSERR